MDMQQKIKRLERNKSYCKNFSQANNFKPLYVYHYEKIINKLKEANDG